MKYKLLVRNCLLTYGLLCLGVYRLVDDVVDDRPNEAKGQRTLTQKRYVITHPPTDFRLIDSDRVSDTLSLAQHDFLMRSEAQNVQ